MGSISKRASKIIKDLRVERGYTQQQVADFIGITRQAYSRYENAQREPSLDIIDKICEFYMFSPTLFFVENYKFTNKKHLLLSSMAAEYEEKYWLNYQKYNALLSSADAKFNDKENTLEYVYKETKYLSKFKEDIVKSSESIKLIKKDLLNLINRFDIENKKLETIIINDFNEDSSV